MNSLHQDVGAMKHKVLIVDDEPEICGLLKLFLEEDFDVVTFTDSRLACAAVDSTHFDLVVSDIKMPYLNGLEVVQHVKSKSPSTEVVLITGHAQNDRDVAGARKLGAAGILFKPFGDPTHLIRYLNQIVTGNVATACDGSIAPFAQSASPPPIVVAKFAPVSVDSSKPTVMVLDDEEDLVEIVVMLLGDEYHSIPFVSAQEAIDKCFDHDFKCIITDLSMPQMSGNDFIRAVRQKLPDVPILVMSGHSRHDRVVHEAMELGAVDLLAKPFPTPEIVRKLLKRYIK